MKKSVVIFITAVCLLITGCGDTGSLSKLPSSSFHEDKQKLTIMHIDADNKRFQDFIAETEKKLDMEITVEKCPSNADNRQAKISTILASGDKNIDLISVNDEMISEFKHKGYLEPLEKNVMTEEVRDSFPQEYLESICEENGHIYSVPFQMDIMMFWVNQELLKQAGLTPEYIGEDYSDEYPKGQVFYQSVSSGTQVEKGTTVKYMVSKGSQPSAPDSGNSGNDSGTEENTNQ